MTIRFGLQIDNLSDAFSETSDSQFLAAVEWRNSRPGISQRIDDESDLKTIGMCWKQQCKSWNKKLGPLFSVLSLWEYAIPKQLRVCRDETFFSNSKTIKRRAASDAISNRLADFIKQDSEELNSDPIALLAAIELLCCSKNLPAKVVGKLWRAVLSAAIAQSNSFQEALSHEWTNIREESLDDQSFLLASGLLPWVCGVLFDDVKGATKLAKSGRRGIAEQLTALTDADGCLHDYALRRASVFLALWRDATILGDHFEQPLWKSNASNRFASFLAKTTALLRIDGRLAVEENTATETSRIDELARDNALCDAKNLASLATLVKSPAKAWAKTASTIANLTSTPSKRRTKKSTPDQTYKKKDAASWQSDESQTACLRATWAASSSLISIAHATPEPWLELAIDGVPLLSGDWHIDIAEDRQFVQIEDDWYCSCWYTDREVDYFEVELSFEDGTDVCRHVLLHRTKQFAVISDVVTSSKAERLDLETFLPLADGVTLSSVEGTRELHLQVGDKLARVYPLALPQDRGIGTVGDAGESDEYGPSLRVTQASTTGGLFSPIVIDWNPERDTSDTEWAPLTVTEAGEIDRTGAAAFRLRVGDLHLVLHRALRKTERYRTVLGTVIENETTIGEFTKKGVIRELVVVQ
jgi:hypothetical protein